MNRCSRLKILAIETSCDETGVAIVEAKKGEKPIFEILSNQLASQTKIHRRFGGVVPNLAKREHQRNLVPLLKSALKETKLLKLKVKNEKLKSKVKNLEKILTHEPELLIQTKKFIAKYQKPDIDAITVTYGPGLEPALWVGVNFAKALSFFWKLPLVKVNHMEGHFYSFLLQQKGVRLNVKGQMSKVFPILALLVSGGHTELVYSPSLLKYKLIGETLDDAAGEAFDKGARLLGIPYPGGAHLAKLAAKGNPEAFNFPRPMIHSKDFNFSFSGLKTALLYKIQSLSKVKGQMSKIDLAASYQQAIVDTLVSKTIKAVRIYNPKSLVLGGGVAANDLLRKTLKEKMAREFPKINLFLPEKELTTDNAVMIGLVGYLHALKKDFVKPSILKAQANLRL